MLIYFKNIKKEKKHCGYLQDLSSYFLFLLFLGQSSFKECRNYQYLNDATRAQGYNRAPVRCDNALATKWYRLTGRSGNQMPTSCVPINRCGTHAPGWLSGRHPSAGQISTVKVCFHWYRLVGRSRRDDCCRWQTFIRVRNCGGFFVYQFKRPPVCRLRYCGK